MFECEAGTEKPAFAWTFIQLLINIYNAIINILCFRYSKYRTYFIVYLRSKHTYIFGCLINFILFLFCLLCIPHPFSTIFDHGKSNVSFQNECGQSANNTITFVSIILMKVLEMEYFYMSYEPFWKVLFAKLLTACMENALLSNIYLRPPLPSLKTK